MIRLIKSRVMTHCIINTALLLGLATSTQSIAQHYSDDPLGLGPNSNQMLPVEELQRLIDSMSTIRVLYVDEVDNKELFDDAISGMLKGLDPHSAYLNEEDLKNLNNDAAGEFGGVGIQVTMQHDLVRVITPIDDTPASRAGIKAGDMIARIENKAVRGMKIDEAVRLMRGEPGKSVHLTILRKGANEPIKVSLVREIIEVISVKHRSFDDRYGYIRISTFGKKTGEELEKAIISLQETAKPKLEGIVLDLRNNPGGLLDAAVEVSDKFLDYNDLDYENMVVSAKGRLPSMNFEGRASTTDLTKGVPIVVIINIGSASAAEIVSGALQDHNRALVIGDKSFGKGSVQTVFPFNDNKGALKLTTARFYTPSGRSIQADGISPDIDVAQVEIPESVKPKDYFTERESDLKDHIDNKQIDMPKALSAIDTEDAKTNAALKEEDMKIHDALFNDKSITAKNLMWKDYQLHQALNMLKGLKKAQQRKLIKRQHTKRIQ